MFVVASCSARSWSAVASEARHRFRLVERVGCAKRWSIRKRRRRCALPAHSTTLARGSMVPRVSASHGECRSWEARWQADRY